MSENEPSAAAQDATGMLIALETGYEDEDAVITMFGISTIYEGGFDPDGKPQPYLEKEVDEAHRQLGHALDAYAAARVAEAVAAAVLEREREIVAAIGNLTSYYCPLADGSEGPPHVSLFDVAKVLRGIESEAAP